MTAVTWSRLGLAALWCCAGAAHAGERRQEPPAFQVTPRVIEVGAFYDGAGVRVEGAAAPGAAVIITIAGSDRAERFNRKARFGPIWISAGKVRFSGAPSLCLRFSTGAPAGLLRREEIAAHGLDEASITARMQLQPAAGGRADAALRADYLALKKHDGIYAFHDSGIRLGTAAGAYSLDFRWPKKAPPGVYTIRVYEVRGGAVVRASSLPLEVVRSGFPAWLAALAEESSAIYGVTAVLVAALAGFGIDFLTTRIFHQKRAASH